MTSAQIGTGQFVVVAAYCPAGRDAYVALGAAAKIEAVLSGLNAVGRQPQLLNSGHQVRGNALGGRTRLMVGEADVEEIHPPRMTIRPLGKLLQVLLAPLYAVRLCRRRNVDGLWLYNPYLFEVVFGLSARMVSPGLPIVLELEDAPMARRRIGLGGLKARLDNLAFRLISRRANVITVVQPGLRKHLTDSAARVVNLPVLLPVERGGETDRFQPSTRICIGYFGGLSVEKGADKLLQVIRKTSGQVFWQVTGAGELEGAFRTLALEMPNVIQFHGTVDAKRLKDIYSSVDSVINLHRPLNEFGDGIFPFKLLEAVGKGKLLISTLTSGCPQEVANSIVWIQGDLPTEACRAISRFDELERETRQKRIAAARWVQSNYGANQVVGQILDLL